jgi:asparagine synthase (glutamine-hydrolysing)
VSQERFQAALQLLDHRGPDACGYLSHQTNQLGHKRLKILDFDDRSNQPFWSADRRYVVIFNGEIYNYRELARKYDIVQRTSSDTEIILELYAGLGSKFVTELNGMFAFVILDTQTGEFLLPAIG